VIVGVGVDVVPVERFAHSLRRTPGLAERLFTPTELVSGSGERRTAESLAARFAAKEALAKALGAPAALNWHDAEVLSAADGRPSFALRDTVAAAAQRLGVARVHVSLSHDGGIASAMVVVES